MKHYLELIPFILLGCLIGIPFGTYLGDKLSPKLPPRRPSRGISDKEWNKIKHNQNK